MFSQSTIRPSVSPPPRVFRREPEPEALDGICPALAAVGSRMVFRAGREIVGEGEPADYVYRVVSGVVRSFRLLSDGRRQICDFHFAGDFVGLEAGVTHRVTAEAISDCVLLAVRRSAMADMAARDGALAGQLWRLAVRAHQRSQDHALVLARQGATERVAAFLLDLAERVDAQDLIDLPMSRQDIADYLGLTIHTVSRTFSQLQETGRIEVESPRRVRLKDVAELAELRG